MQAFAHKNRVLAALVSVVLVVCLFSFVDSVKAGQNLPLPVSRLLFKVSRLFEKGEYSEAAELIMSFQKERSRSEYGKHPEIFFVLGNCYLSMKRYALAADAYREALRKRKDHAPSWLNLANALYNMEDYKGAASCFERAFSLKIEKEPELLYYSGVCRLLAGDSAGAVKVFERLFREFPAGAKPAWKEGLARALISNGQGRRAIPVLEEIVQEVKGRERKEWSEVLLYQYLDNGMYRRASGLALELAEQWPEEERWWKALVNVSLKDDRLEDALMGMMIISYLRPLDGSEARLLADLNLQSDIPIKALPVYERLLSKGDSSEREKARLLKYVLFACIRLGERQRAISLLEQYHAIAGRDPALLLTWGDLLYNLKRYGEAFDLYVKAAGMEQKGGRNSGQKAHTGRAWLMAGYSAWQAGKIQCACRAFREAERFKAQKSRAGEMLSYLRSLKK